MPVALQRAGGCSVCLPTKTIPVPCSLPLLPTDEHRSRCLWMAVHGHAERGGQGGSGHHVAPLSQTGNMQELRPRRGSS